MRAIERKALRRARRWLAGLEMCGMALEVRIERLFGLGCCTAAINDIPTLLGRHIRKLEQFPWFRYRGDPVCGLALLRMLENRNFPHASLRAFRDGCSEIVKSERKGSKREFALIGDLLGLHDVTLSEFSDEVLCLPEELAGWVVAGRGNLMEACRMVTVASSCGLRKVDAGDLPLILPHLGFSYARDWDLECTCAVLRACAYLKVSCMPSVRSAMDWLLDQQQSNGQFGLTDSTDLLRHVHATVNAVWTIAELNEPGFLLEARP